MPVSPCFDPVTGASGGSAPSGGGSYDVSPPAATSSVAALGVSLPAKTFGSFTGADAGLIDGYTLRTNNAVGTTSWSGSGLGAYTPSGDADGSNGSLALDATIGGVVVATALHGYSRAGAAPASEHLVTWEFEGADTGSLGASGTITSGGGAVNIVNYVNTLFSGSVASESAEITASGAEITRDNGNSVRIFAFDIADVLAMIDEGRDKLLAFVQYSAITSTPATNQNLTTALADVATSISNNPNRGVMLNVTGASDVDVNMRQYTTGVSTVKQRDYGAAMPTQGWAVLEVDVDRVRAGFSDSTSQPARSAVSMGTVGGSSESPSATIPSMPWTYLMIAVNPQVGGSLAVTIPRIVWYRLAQGAS